MVFFLIMGYSIELGYPTETRRLGEYAELVGFKAARVLPFTGGSIQIIDPAAQELYRGLSISPYEYGDSPLEYDETDLEKLPPVDDAGLIRAEISVTRNYSERIAELTESHLSNLHGQTGAEGSSMLMVLLAGLNPDEEFTDYWSATDGNIRRLTETILEWTFQHPDATFRSLG